MTYAGLGTPLVLLSVWLYNRPSVSLIGICRLTDSGTLTRCEITTFEPEPALDLPFDNDRRVQRVIMKVFIPIFRVKVLF
jgi:hypothetical protein